MVKIMVILTDNEISDFYSQNGNDNLGREPNARLELQKKVFYQAIDDLVMGKGRVDPVGFYDKTLPILKSRFYSDPIAFSVDGRWISDHLVFVPQRFRKERYYDIAMNYFRISLLTRENDDRLYQTFRAAVEKAIDEVSIRMEQVIPK